MIANDEVIINGDGETSRDFCFVANAVQANLRATLAPQSSHNEIYNVAVGDRTTLNELFAALKESLGELQIRYTKEPVYTDFRAGDVRHSQADIHKAREKIGYEPTHKIRMGIDTAMPWYVHNLRNQNG